MGWQPGAGRGTGGEPGLPSPGGGGAPGPGGGHPATPGFARGGQWDACPPSAALAAALEAAAGPGWRCPGASHDERMGMLGRLQALEAWVAAGKLGLLRDLIREDDALDVDIDIDNPVCADPVAHGVGSATGLIL